MGSGLSVVNRAEKMIRYSETGSEGMPIYEYQCRDCGEEFEKLLFGPRQVRCPRCESEDVRKKFSLFGMSGVEKAAAGASCSTCSSKRSSCSSCD